MARVSPGDQPQPPARKDHDGWKPVTDIDPGAIRRWQASRRLAERVAARLAVELRGRQRWDPVEGDFRIAVRMDVSESTARRAKALLANCGAIMKDATSGRTGYFVT
jgi:hypothetical protein